MKKLAALLMALVLLFTLAACGGDKEKTGTDAKGNSGEDASASDTVTTEQETTEKQEDKPVFSFEEFVAVDNENYTIKVTELEPGNLAGYGIGMQIENKNEQMDYSFCAEVTSINGIYTDTFFAEDVPAGKKAKVSMFLDDSIIRKNGITEYTDIEIVLSVSDATDWFADPISTETIHIYPYGEENAQKYRRESAVTDIVVLDNEEIRMTVIGFGEDDYDNYGLDFYLENKSDDVSYMYAVENCAVNGVEIVSTDAYIVPAGRIAFGEFTVTDESLEENGITDYTDIKLTLRVYDSDDWEAKDVAYETVNIYPQGMDKAVKFERATEDTDTVIIDNEYATVVVTGIDESGKYFTNMDLYYVNKTDKNLVFSVEESSINDNMIDPFYADSVGAGNCKFSTIEWDKEEISGAEITEIEKFEFSLRVYDGDTLKDCFNEKIIYNP